MDINGLTDTPHFAPFCRAGTVLVLCLLLLAGCDSDGPADAPQQEQQPSAERDAEPDEQARHHDLTEVSPDDIVDLRSPDEDAFISLNIGGTQMFSSCREIFEEDGDILDWPLADYETSAAIFGCDPDGYIEFDNGQRAIAYEIPIADHDRATDLRVLLYDEDGTLSWQHVMDRSREVNNFAANYRGSYLTAVGEHLVCAGTRWQAGTQALCVRLESGNIVYDGRMNFWAGVKPFGFESSLYAADLNGITQRYPFSGSEMRHRAFDERGGRAGFYGTDERRIFFVPSRGDTVLSAWDLESMTEIWSADVTDIPKSGYSHANADHQLFLFVVDETMFGLDATTGALRMAFDIGGETPPIAFGDDEFYMLLRRANNSPLIYAIDSESGEIRWSAEAPAGSLRITYDGETLMSRTVRTVRTIEPMVP